LESFADLCCARQPEVPFLDDETWREQLTMLHRQSLYHVAAAAATSDHSILNSNDDEGVFDIRIK